MLRHRGFINIYNNQVCKQTNHKVCTTDKTLKFKVSDKFLHLSLNTFEEEMDGRESGSEICVKRLGATYTLNTAAKKASVLPPVLTEQRLE